MLRKDAILPQPTPSQISTVSQNITPRPKPLGYYIPCETQKRTLSADSTPSPMTIIQVDKKHRSDSLFDCDNMEAEPEQVITLADIMAQLKLTAKVSDLDSRLEEVAKKKDLLELQNTVALHTLELQQIREDLLQQTKRVQELETNLGQQAASMLKRTQPDVYFTRTTQHGGAQSGTSVSSLWRKNLVFEGLPLLPDREIIGLIIEMCSSLNIVAYQSDFEAVVQLTRRDGSSKPPPILVTFAQTHIRSALLRNKYKLQNHQKFATVFVNLDEPVETRRAKAIFRRVAFLAKQDGKSVLLRDDWIRIEDVEYKIADLEKIPEEYRSSINAPPNAKDGGSTSASASTPSIPSRPKEVKIKMTKTGLTFSGGSAFLSHMYKCPIVCKKIPYSSVEQGYHHLHAEFEKEPEIAAKILNEHEPLEIKIISAALPKSEGWKQVGPGYMWELNEAKFDQNPDLKKELISTAPALLIEASVDSRWGGGGSAPLEMTSMNKAKYQVAIFAELN